MNKFVTICLLSATTLTLGGCQTIPVVHGGGGVVVQDKESRVAVVFTTGDRRLIHDYYYSRHQAKRGKGKKRMPPGLAKREHLPPGLAKREHLPPGLSGRSLPHELERQLSPLPQGVSRVRIGAQIVLIDDNSRVVLDVIKDIPLD